MLDSYHSEEYNDFQIIRTKEGGHPIRIPLGSKFVRYAVKP